MRSTSILPELRHSPHGDQAISGSRALAPCTTLASTSELLFYHSTSTMKTQACEPCAKRKVRCDREEPCSNCKRRKQDHCNYPDVSPFDRIKSLEAEIRRLRGEPVNIDGQDVDAPTKKSSSPARSRSDLSSGVHGATQQEGANRDPVVLQEDGQTFYLDACVALTRRIVLDHR